MRKPRRVFQRVNYADPNWPNQARELERQRRQGRVESVKHYKKRRLGIEPPLDLDNMQLPLPPRKPIMFSQSDPRWRSPFAPIRRTYSKSKFAMNEIDALHKKQDGLCAICQRMIPPFGMRRAVDHCHRTGRVRGMLCKACNLGLGLFKDDPTALLNAIVYLGFLDRRFFNQDFIIREPEREWPEKKEGL